MFLVGYIGAPPTVTIASAMGDIGLALVMQPPSDSPIAANTAAILRC